MVYGTEWCVRGTVSPTAAFHKVVQLRLPKLFQFKRVGRMLSFRFGTVAVTRSWTFGKASHEMRERTTTQDHEKEQRQKSTRKNTDKRAQERTQTRDHKKSTHLRTATVADIETHKQKNSQSYVTTRSGRAGKI
jgi:hypothetical protein